MSATFTFDGKRVHYEVYGQGEPLLVLNGIFMSTVSWRAFIPTLSKNNQLVLLDFLDQGGSENMTGDYSQDLQAQIAWALIKHLRLERVHVLGISYGGEVAMLMAIKYPEVVAKLILANTTPYTNAWLQDMGKAWEYAIGAYDGRQFFKTCIPVVYSPGFYTRNIEWLKRREELFSTAFTPAIYQAFLRLIKSAENFDVRQDLPTIKTPTLVISSEHDYVTPL